MYLTCKEEVRYGFLDYRPVILLTGSPFEKEYQSINRTAKVV
jgi:hypothetical protein